MLCYANRVSTTTWKKSDGVMFRPGWIIPILSPIILTFNFPRTLHYSHNLVPIILGNLVPIILDYSQ